jgi:hypothetical protein
MKQMLYASHIGQSGLDRRKLKKIIEEKLNSSGDS